MIRPHRSIWRSTASRQSRKAAGLDLSHMVFVNPYLTGEIPMRIMNEHYAKRFEFGNTPARSP